MTRKKFFDRMSAFCDSALLQYLYVAAAVCIILFSRVTEKDAVVTYGNYVLFYGIAGFAIAATIQLLFCRHIVATALPFLLICCYSLKCYDVYDTFMQSFTNYQDETFLRSHEDFLKFMQDDHPRLVILLLLMIVGVAFICALIARIFFLRRMPFRPSPTFWSLLPVSIAVILGGIGFITFEEYKSMIYYVIGLGIGLMALCALLSSQYEDDHTYDLTDYYERSMCLVALFAIFMVLHFYIQNWASFWETKQLLDFQWRNNISTMLMIVIPFVFSRAHKNFLWFFVGLAGAATLVLANSRGGILFGMMEVIACIVVYLICERSWRQEAVFVMLGIGAVVGTVFVIKEWNALKHVLYRFLFFSNMESLQEETRYKMIVRAWEQFKDHPIFGQGLGYDGTHDIYAPRKGALYFYHCAPAQIIASLGSIGIIAYLSQCVMQARILLRNRTRITATVAISIISLWGMSMVNPGIFSPVPYAMMIPLHLIVVEKSSPKRRSL